MNGPRISAAPGGITINATLAWAIVVSLVGVLATSVGFGLTIGAKVSRFETGLAATMSEIARANAEIERARTERAALEGRMRSADLDRVRDTSRLDTAVTAIAELKAETVETNRLVRQVLARLGVSADN